MSTKTYAKRNFRFKNLHWHDGIRYTSPAEFEIIKTIPAEFPITLRDGTVLNPPEETEQLPDDSWKVAEIKTWLDGKTIKYTSDMVKADLLEMAAPIIEEQPTE